jgi:hypothetical protein
MTGHLLVILMTMIGDASGGLVVRGSQDMLVSAGGMAMRRQIRVTWHGIDEQRCQH